MIFITNLVFSALKVPQKFKELKKATSYLSPGPPQFHTKRQLLFSPKISQFHTKTLQFNTKNPSVPHQKPLISTQKSSI